MKTHFGFTEDQMKELAKKRVSIADLFNFAKDYDITGKGCEISVVNLLHYVDKKGDFNNPPHFKHRLIAREIFKNLCARQKLEVMGYLADLEDGEL